MTEDATGESKPRSLVFDIFGEYVRADGGYLTLQALSRLLEPFDVPPDSLRVLMSRLRREGWFRTMKSGRISFYLPAKRGWDLLDEGYVRIMGAPHENWSGEWHVVIFSVPETERSARGRIRKQLAWLGFGPLAASTWISPWDRLREATNVLAAEPCAQYDRLVARSLSREEDLERAARCWDLASLADGYRDYLNRWEKRLSRLRADLPEPERAFVLRTQVIHEYRKFLFTDPGLPAQLLPDDWPGKHARETMLSVFEVLREPATRFYQEVTAEMARPAGDLPPVPPLPC
ncbi:PaaX family transcriptional regulator [Amycolatopsis anabasis]|uniref:PaaX family transcriptional regulator n=1 Tax=Amycolatopsis anabasis TaxID=1840409 RepID=UPI00131E70A3|nr:PaaX family transcriptional regulator C-terminal domain-containing protein [Amycolatopsis anabasis]